jgi:hypothetical protein
MTLENNQDKSHGGARKGAGRKPGSANKKTREIADKAIAEGLTPLEFMLQIMRDEPPETEDARLQLAQQAMRFEAAKAAAPYVHPRLGAVEHTGRDGSPLIPPTFNFVRSAD